MSIIYGISMIILFTLVVLLKKSKEKLEITKTIIVAFTLTLAYNTLCSYILNLVNIPITLLSLSIINVIFSMCILVKIIKDKEIQKYTINKVNILVVLFFAVITAVIIHMNFGDLTKIRYISMDAREHYKAAREFSENTALSNKQVENNTVGSTFMPMGYVNAGIIFKILEPYIGTVNLYKVYILFEAFIYLLAGLMFYVLVEKYTKKLNSKIIAIIFSIIYILGYPLNAWISGFHYLVIGILFVEGIIYINMLNRKLNFEYDLIVLFLLNFGLILSYSLFCPFVYLAEAIYYIYMYKKEKATLFLYIWVTLVCTGIIGVTYLIIPSIGQVGSFIALEGWVYKNIWSNFILFVPFSVYAIYKSIKDKEFTFDNLIFTLLLAYMLVLFIGTKMGKCSEYYFYKNYFILWLLLAYLNIKGMIKFANNRNANILTNVYTILYLAIFVISMYTQKTYIMHQADDSIEKTMQIFTFNNTMICVKNAEFINKNELNLYENMEKIISNNWRKCENNILFITDPTQERWIQSLTGYKNILFDNREYAIENLKSNNYKYIVISKNKITYKIMEEYINIENFELIYETNDGQIYMKREGE